MINRVFKMMFPCIGINNGALQCTVEQHTCAVDVDDYRCAPLYSNLSGSHVVYHKACIEV